MYMYSYIYIYAYVVHAGSQLHIISIYIHICIPIGIWKYVHMYACTSISIYICVCICIYVCIYIYRNQHSAPPYCRQAGRREPSAAPPWPWRSRQPAAEELGAAKQAFRVDTVADVGRQNSVTSDVTSNVSSVLPCSHAMREPKTRQVWSRSIRWFRVGRRLVEG